ncbi:MAG TPA: SpoIIE family protein phosphatase [Candidatus Baltobacteraceae bacterium]|nr:SpoIIE family protein phosphatase [Candidatus Baltobacteraceae bacterium]
MARRGPAETAPLDDERLARVARNVPIGFFEADSHGALTFVSAQWCEITGVAADRALGRGWLGTVHPDDRARLEHAWDDAVAHVGSLEATFRLVRGGDVISVRISIGPVNDSAGLLDLFAGAAIDVTEIAYAGEQITHTLERFRMVAEIMPQFIWVAGPDGRIHYFNRPWLEYTGLSVEAMHADGVKNVVHPDELGLTWERWNNALVTGRPYEIEYRLRSAATGEYRWFIARAVPERDAHGDIVRWIGTATDIDAQKRATDNLRFVLDASNALAANLDVDAVCATLADIATTRVADWCFIVLKKADGGYETRAIAHRDSGRRAQIEHLRKQNPIKAGSPLDRAIRRNTPMLIPAITARELSAVAIDPGHLQALHGLAMRSAMLVPIATDQGIVYGGIMLASSESARAYTARDLEVAEMVAHRAAAAIHTATAFDLERALSQRLRFIAEVSELLVEAAGLQMMLDRLVQFIAGRMADLAYVVLAEDRDVLRTVACAHADPEMRPIAERLRGQRTLRPEAEENAIWMLSQHRTLLHKTVPAEAVLAGMWEYLAPEVRALGIHSAITIPLFSRGETFGALIVYWCNPERTYTEDDAEVFTDVGRRLSIAIEHQHTLERERRIAEALQQALLPQPGMLPVVPGLHFAAHYRPSRRESDVGGDWYDALTLRDGSILVSAGDVTGRGLHAAGLMGKLRQAIGMAAMYERDPARILDAVDFHLRSRRSNSLATAFVGIIDAARTKLQYAGAGHPPPLMRRGGELLELHSTGLPLGLRDQHEPQQSAEISLEGCDLLVLYTDGLVEGTRDLSFGEQRLAFLAASEAISFVRNPAAFLCDACLPPDAHDDTAVLTVSFGERTSWAFDAENAQAAHEARAQLVAYLRERASGQADIGGAELVFGELVGNVVRHAPGPIEVQVEWTGRQPTLHVIDRGRGFLRDPSLPIDVLSESGRGLYIVSQLTQALRIERIAGYGNHVAAVLRL